MGAVFCSHHALPEGLEVPLGVGGRRCGFEEDGLEGVHGSWKVMNDTQGDVLVLDAAADIRYFFIELVRSVDQLCHEVA